METITSPILFIGAGNMAHAIFAGARQAGVLDASMVGALDPNAERRSLFPHAFVDAAKAVEWLGSHESEAATIVLGVKPQMLGDAVGPLLGPLESLDFEALIVSILAGTRVARIQHAFHERVRAIRVMPNTPAQVGLGMSAIAPGPKATPLDLKVAGTLFAAVGETITIDEQLMDAFTGIAGSGPAYIFYLAEGMVRAAMELGFDRGQALRIVRQTVLGSATLLAKSDELPGELRAKVTSKNGTTYAGTTTLDEHGVMEAVVAAITAARDRGEELAREG